MRKTILSLFLAAVLLCPLLAACGEAEGTGESESVMEDVAGATDIVEESDELTYVVPDVNYNGEEIRILNTTNDMWGCYNLMDTEEMTGDLRNDTIFNRNAAIETDMNVDIVVENLDLYELNGAVSTAVQSGDALYDVTYVKADESANLLSQKMLYNLYDVEGLQLEKPWWDQYVRTGLTVDDKLFFISSPAQMMTIGLTTTVYINKNSVIDMGMDMPYDLVREGKWTFDAMYTYIENFKSTGTQTDWTYDENGDATYGVVLHDGMRRNMLFSTGESLVTIDSKGQPVYTTPSERFYNIVEKLAATTSCTEGKAISQHDGVECTIAFNSGRTLFRYWELSTIDTLREMEEDFGVLPSPKFDEAQDTYCSMTSEQGAKMCIPVTNLQPEMAATVMDYMSYLSLRDLWPAHIETHLTNKGLRDEDSVEMVNLIRETIGIDTGMVYGWTKEFIGEVAKQIKAGESTVASLVASYDEVIQTAIEKSLTDWNK